MQFEPHRVGTCPVRNYLTRRKYFACRAEAQAPSRGPYLVPGLPRRPLLWAINCELFLRADRGSSRFLELVRKLLTHDLIGISRQVHPTSEPAKYSLLHTSAEDNPPFRFHTLSWEFECSLEIHRRIRHGPLNLIESSM